MCQRSLAFVLPLDEEFINHGYAINGTERVEAPWLSLAHTLAASPMWAEMSEVLLIVRLTPQPMLGFLGDFSPAAVARIKALHEQLKDTLTRLRYVSYAQAEKDCERLAAELISRFGSDALRRFRFTAIPRGGSIVLGMLAYILKLEHIQLEPPYPSDVPLVVVDDCALSGARFVRFLKRCENHPIIFAHLYSHPDLRNSIEAKESNVIACLSAQDLHDHAPERFGDACSDWRKRWLDRLDDSRHWVGLPDHICFAWGEPDRGFWNPVTERVESAWRIVPPALCLKNRPVPGTEPSRVQIQPEGKGPLEPAAHVLFGELNGQTIIGNLETGESFKLSGVAADIWRSVIEYGNLEDVVAALLKIYDVDEATIRTDLHAFVSELLDRGLLEGV